MSLDSTLSIATGGLANINAQFSLISQNVANAATPGYALEVSNQQSITADGVGMGVRTAPATLQINQALQASVIQQNALVSGAQTTQTALQAIDSVQGTPGAGTDLGSLLGKVQNSFSTLLTNPSSQTQQSAVVSAAATLAQGINSLSSAYSAQRQAAQDGIASGVNTLNTTLAAIGQISNQIIALQPTNQSTADLQNQRNAAVQTLSQMLSIRTAQQPNGDLTIFTSGGLTLPTRGGAAPFSIATANTPPGAYYPNGGLPGIMLNGADVTSQITGGQIGANIALRDTTLPTDQAALDEFSQGLSGRFAAQGLTLFTSSSGAMPAGGGSPVQSGYVGYAATIQVNPAVSANPALVRDGTNATAGFTPNPSGGPAGFTTLISNVIDYTFGTQSQSGVSQPSMNTSGLGPAGNLSTPFSAATGALGDFATSLTSSQARQSADTTTNLATQQALQTSLTSKASATSGVNMDTEMSQMLSLQNAYSANAKVIATIQAMYTELMQDVQ